VIIEPPIQRVRGRARSERLTSALTLKAGKRAGAQGAYGGVGTHIEHHQGEVVHGAIKNARAMTASKPVVTTAAIAPAVILAFSFAV
jgi:hypothetical protein